MRALVALPLLLLALAGCSGGGGGGATGTFELHVVDAIVSANLPLRGVFASGPDGWQQAMPEGTSLAFDGAGENLTLTGKLPAGNYSMVRILFGNLTVDGQAARMTETGLELELPLNVTDGGRTVLTLAFAWGDALFKAEGSLAFAPALAGVTLVEDGATKASLQASQIQTATKVPVARTRIFDETGLEVFQSSFVADSPEKPVIGNAGVLTLSASPSAAVKKGASIANYTWEIGGGLSLKAYGITARPEFPISGGNFTVRLTVVDSQGLSDSQTVKLALKPGTRSMTLNFTGSASGLTAGTSTVGGNIQEHKFAVAVDQLNGSAAQLVRVAGVLGASSSVPVNELNVELLDANGTSVASTSAAGSQDSFDVEAPDSVAGGEWTLRVSPGRAYESAYTVRLTLTWKGVNPGIEAFLKGYDDGHTHQH